MEQLHWRHFDAIYRFCYRLLPDRQVAEDAVARVFLHLAVRWHRLESKDDKGLRNWLYGEARNAVRYHRREATKQHQALQELWRRNHLRPHGQAPMADRIEPSMIYEAIQRMKPGDQELIALRFMERLSLKETAEIVGKSQVAVRVGLMRALRRLKALLQKLPEQ